MSLNRNFLKGYLMKGVFSTCIVKDIDSIHVSIAMYIIAINFKKDLNYELKLLKRFFVVSFCFNDLNLISHTCCHNGCIFL